MNGTDQHIKTLREERDWWAVAIANAVAAGRPPEPEHVTAFRDSNSALNDALGIATSV